MGGVNELPEGVLGDIEGHQVHHEEVPLVVLQQAQRVAGPLLHQRQQVSNEGLLVSISILHIGTDAVRAQLILVTPQQAGRIGNLCVPGRQDT